MKVKQAIKHLTLLSIIAVGMSGCASTEEPKPQPKPVVEEVVVEEPVIVEEEVIISAVINNGVIDIPVMENAKIFAEYSDGLPAVLNYFTSSSKEQVIDFYQQAFGEPYSQEVKRDRLTLKYQQGEELMRVVISQQNKKRQVDVIIESKK